MPIFWPLLKLLAMISAVLPNATQVRKSVSYSPVCLFLNARCIATLKLTTLLFCPFNSGSATKFPTPLNWFIIHHPYLIVLVLHLILRVRLQFLFAILYLSWKYLTNALFYLVLRRGLFLARYLQID